MTKSKIVLACISLAILVVRVVLGREEAIPAGTRVKLTIPTIDYPEYTDSQTIIRRGEWEAKIKGYTDFIPGDVIEVQGVVDVRGRVAEAEVLSIKDQELAGVDWGLVQISKLRQWAVGRLQQVLPEPHASLAVGILLGVKRNMPREFYDQLINTGTLHVVAASGYNVSVVAGSVISVFGGILGQKLGLGMGLFAILVYVILAGGSAAVVRAGVMGGLTLIGIMLGRVREAKWLLWVSAWIMLMVKPSLSTDIGFQLSMSATVGLLYLSPIFLKLSTKQYFVDYLYPTIAATIATTPVIWWHFGRVSLIGILVNMLILPIVPVIMLFSTLAVIVSPISYLLYVPLWWMVMVIRIFG